MYGIAKLYIGSVCRGLCQFMNCKADVLTSHAPLLVLTEGQAGKKRSLKYVEHNSLQITDEDHHGLGSHIHRASMTGL